MIKWIYGNVFWLAVVCFSVMYCLNIVNGNSVMAVVDFIGIYSNMILQMLMYMFCEIREAE